MSGIPGYYKIADTSTEIKPAPTPLTFAIPAFGIQPASGNPRIVDAYTAQYTMTPPLVIPPNSSVGLTQASFSYTQPNIVGANVLASVPNGNNRISIQDGTANPWLDIVFPVGLYGYPDIQNELNIYVRTHNASGGTTGPFIVTGATDLFQLVGIPATQQLIISLNPLALTGGVFPAGGFSVSFTNPSPSGAPTHASDSMGEVLGYPTTGGTSSFTAPAGSSAVYSSYSPNATDFASTSAYALYMSFVANSYINGQIGSIVYSFPLGNYGPNQVVSFQPTLRFPVPVATGNYVTLNVWTADQNGNRLPLQYYQSPFQFSLVVAKNKNDGSL